MIQFKELTDAMVAGLEALGFDKKQLVFKSATAGAQKGDYVADLMLLGDTFSVMLGLVTIVRATPYGTSLIGTTGAGSLQIASLNKATIAKLQ